ncbi:MAG: outer membrane lipid asymmetry maintenance protein MlaD [Paracoccaceae bacterium]|nr:outer membrane lipid asymmetry maintenance protein MlaD [Paracoccaceae bacterium]
MAESITEVATGALVLAAAGGFLVYATQFADIGGGGAGTYELTASFRSVEGVVVGTDVRLGGVKVGTVTELDLNPETFMAETVFSIEDEIVLPDDTAVIIASEGLLGGTFVELLPGGSPFNLEPGGELVDTQSAVSLIQLLLRFATGGDE